MAIAANTGQIFLGDPGFCATRLEKMSLFIRQMRTLLFCLLAVCVLSGCSQQEDSQSEHEYQAHIQNLIPPDKDAAARRFIELIRVGDIGQAQQMVGSPLQVAYATNLFEQLHDLIKEGQLLDVEPIGYQAGREITYAGQAISLDTLTYQLHFEKQWYVAIIAVENSPEPNAVVGIKITFFNGYESPAAFNRFSFAGRTWRDWAAFVLCLVTPVFIISATAICACSPVRRKWLWIVFILIGIVQFRYDWTHALVDVNPLAIQLLGSGYQRADIYSPLFLVWAIPVGAFIFLIFRRQLIKAGIQKGRKSPKKRSSGRSA